MSNRDDDQRVERDFDRSGAAGPRDGYKARGSRESADNASRGSRERDAFDEDGSAPPSSGAEPRGNKEDYAGPSGMQPDGLIESNWDEVVDSFDDMGLREELLRGVYAYGFEKPSAIQQRAIMPCIKGHDVIAQAQSGTGKTATFAVSILERMDPSVKECQALVLAPTRELANQIQKVIFALGDYMHADCHACIGGTNVREDLQRLGNGVQVVVGTPGRVFDMINRKALNTKFIRQFILDEADEMLSRGFKDQIYDVFRTLSDDIQVILLSATMPMDVLEVTKRFMRNPIRILVKKEELTLEGIRQFYVELEQEKPKEAHTDPNKIYSTEENRNNSNNHRLVEKVPVHWPKVGVKRVLLPRTTRRYRDIDDMLTTATVKKLDGIEMPIIFGRRRGKEYVLRRIIDIQNRHRLDRYLLHRKHIAQEVGDEGVNERVLLHGTSEETAIEISEGGFNRSFASEDGSFGSGNYFGRILGHIVKFSRADEHGVRCFIMSRVLLGKSGLAESTDKQPPIYGYEGRRCHSTLDDLTHPTVYITYDDDSTYPFAIVFFIIRDRKRGT